MLTTSVVTHLSLYDAITVPLTIFPMLCLLFPWLIHSITGSLYLPLPFTHFAHAPTPAPLTTTSLFSILMGLFLRFVRLFVLFFRFCIRVKACGIWSRSFDKLTKMLHHLVRISVGFFFFFLPEIHKLILKCVWRCKELKILKQSWKGRAKWRTYKAWFQDYEVTILNQHKNQ